MEINQLWDSLEPGQNPRHVDLAATMSAILGIDPPAQSEGRVLRESLLL
ncbi:hypothetical protein ABN034_12775 [Actinopolymorpha sp. B11F2]